VPAAPLIVSFAVGEVVPMPTLPAEFTLNKTVPKLFCTSKRSAVCEAAPWTVSPTVLDEPAVTEIDPALKFPDGSRLIIVEATLALVAVLARLNPELNVFQSVLDKYPLVLVVA
jgi:hypothetical protein